VATGHIDGQLIELTRQRRMSGRRVCDTSLQRVQLHRRVVLTLALSGRESDFRIVVHAQGFGVGDLAVYDELNLVDACKHQRTEGSGPAKAKATAGRHGRATRAKRASLLIRALTARPPRPLCLLSFPSCPSCSCCPSWPCLARGLAAAGGS